MRKPDSLRAWLLRSVAGLSDHPERLHLFIEDGQLFTVKGETLSYAYRYNLDIVLEDFGQPSEALFVPLLAWISEHQPDLIAPGDNSPIAIAQDILGNTASDFRITLPLSENAIVTATEQGGWQVEYPPETRLPDEFAGVTARLWRLYFNHGTAHDLVAVHPDHIPTPDNP